MSLTVHIYLKDGIQGEHWNTTGVISNPNGEDLVFPRRPRGWGVYREYNGQWLVKGDPFDPTNEEIVLPPEFVDTVTLKDVIYAGMRRDGVYLLNGGTLRASTSYDHEHNRAFQYVDGSGPSLEIVQKIYAQFRQGDLEPDKDWTRPSHKREAFLRLKNWLKRVFGLPWF